MENGNRRQGQQQNQKMKKKTQVWSNLPEELLMNIFLQLPVNSLWRVKITCKLWHNLIADPYFLKLHLNRKIVEDEDIRLLIQTSPSKFNSMAPTSSKSSSSSIESFALVQHNQSNLPIDGASKATILASCHGVFLVLTIKDQTRFLWLWNPFTGDVIKLRNPPSAQSIFTTAGRCMYGIGCDSNSPSGDYKVVRIRCLCDLKPEVMIYSLQEDTWRVIEANVDRTSLFPFLNCDYRTSCYVSGCVHWLGYCFTYDDRRRCRIMCFDFGTEEFKLMPVPDAQELGIDWARLGVLRGCLSIVYHYYYGKPPCVEIFLMKEHGVGESWCKEHVVSNYQMYVIGRLALWSFLSYTKDGKLLLLVQHKELYLYDPETRTCERLKFFSLGRPAMAYLPSLVPLTCHK